MRIKSSLRLRKIADEYIMILERNDSLDYTTAVALNDTAAFLITRSREQEITAQSWACLLADEYDVDLATAERDALALIESLRELGAIID